MQTHLKENIEATKKKAALYIDGFNFYHALADLNEPHLKWFNWWQYAQNICHKHNLELVKIVFCTAKPTQKPLEVRQRYDRYIKALQNSGIEVKSGYFMPETITCNQCSAFWEKYTEKQGDVNLAVSLTTDALRNVFDIAFLVTSDSDQLPAISSVVQNTDHQVVTLYPDWRNEKTKASQSLANECHLSKHKIIKNNALKIAKKDIQQNLFGKLVKHPTDNSKNIRRPEEYTPPKQSD